MKGFVPTPDRVVDRMVARLFKGRPPTRASRLLDPGCGHGAFIQGVLRWCRKNQQACPIIVGVEQDPDKLQHAAALLSGEAGVTLLQRDFLLQDLQPFDYIIANPPYVAIEKLSLAERTKYRERFATATGRLDLYLLFWERSLQLLTKGGRLVFITPEKYTYVESARPLRKVLDGFHVEEVMYAAEDTFPGLTTYPAITTVVNIESQDLTSITFRDGRRRKVRLQSGGDSWQASIHGAPDLQGRRTLKDIALRVSCGVATGADKVFLFDAASLPDDLGEFSHPTIAGRELRAQLPFPSPRKVLVTPYDRQGRLLPIGTLASLAKYLHRPEVKKRLEARTCVEHKPWYAFHETPPMPEILRPKIVCKDITGDPYFWTDKDGDRIPMHSTYYIVPRAPEMLEPLARFLNSPEALEWLRGHCQRAANGFYRVQSAILKKLPVPDALTGHEDFFPGR